MHESLPVIEIARVAHNDEPWSAGAAPFIVDGVQVGFVPPCVMAAATEYVATHPVLEVGDSLAFAAHIDTPATRTEAIAAFVTWLRDTRRFPDPLDGWRDERYSIYGRRDGRVVPVFELERAACGLFGVVTFGIHLTAYTADGRIWVPQRSRTKQTWPGYLDNSVAGGITAGESVLETVVRECEEEASLPAHIVRPALKAGGTISYFYRTSAGWHQPEMQCLPADVELKPCDGEAESFTLADQPTIFAWLREGRFKPNCALGTYMLTTVLLDFFVRHGIIPRDHVDYSQLDALLHADLRLPVP
ncbi:thiamine diphosphokinase [Malassezia cuniculi]|uniref:Thiamine diphosphokinase n=1 Tax=Malassezia cuniculi TaxID=948313 RepID=A0AAF0J876_9BASI|nr:thiamine diphosphokinase [Malassezia cuniculi]